LQDQERSKENNNKSNMEEKIDRKDEEMVFPISCLFWIVIGVGLGSCLGSPILQDIIDIYHGYRWNYEEKCIIDEGYFAGGFCRQPLRCTCEDVNKIDELHASEMTESVFEERYANNNRPVVIRNATLEWEAMKLLNYEWLKKAYLSNPETLKENWENCFFKCYQTTEFKSLGDVFKISPERYTNLLTANPWYVGWSVCQESILQQITKMISLPKFLENYQSVGNLWIFIGTPGYGAHHHLDNDLDLPTWQAQLSGSKTWFLTPPPECASVCPGLLEADIHPGDMILVNTNFWMHSTKVLNDGISLVVTRQLS